MSHPTTMKAWLYSHTTPTLEQNLTLTPTATPPPPPKPTQLLIRVLTCALNPADYKVPSMPIISRLLIRKPASPCLDFAGEIITPGSSVTEFTAGQIVYGTLPLPTQFGPFGEYILAETEHVQLVPEGVGIDHAATVGVAGQTAWQAISPYVTPDKGDKVLIVGASGGCGIYAVQIAKALGCEVTAVCSTKKVEFVKGLGADEVIDYAKEDVVEVLKGKGKVFKLVVDHVGEPTGLYAESEGFLVPGGVFTQVGAHWMPTFMVRMLRPRFLGGGKAKYVPIFWKSNRRDLTKVGELIAEGKVKVVLDSVFEFEEAPKAFEKLREGRARGKIVVHVGERK
ncbi:zinc alcohol dehydrogenase [Aspergillus sclerotioniger CBS 115572]|uniref:Zinc alcohol dehydrogenase n=1 Tax=Aspergillus sclerotioniger CBS 115572 TaxID=1450535 RepID=A0A317WEY1_9EURO|nr:zinc alcohol dehydrogenase [Aspergillus sclerotioniger CBS 115572]PWY83782.1 zinc alcohol dehydrogenase [Aspergillus sclerotioniger CBS 115572]